MRRIIQSIYNTISSSRNTNGNTKVSSSNDNDNNNNSKYVTKQNVIFSNDYRNGYRRQWIDEIKK